MSDNAFPFDTPEDEAAALFDKLTADQLAEYRARVLAGEIEGAMYWDYDTACGCAYGTFLLVTKQTEWLDKFYSETDVCDFFWNIESCAPYTPLEVAVLSISPGDTPETNERSEWLLAQVDAAIARK